MKLCLFDSILVFSYDVTSWHLFGHGEAILIDLCPGFSSKCDSTSLFPRLESSPFDRSGSARVGGEPLTKAYRTRTVPPGYYRTYMLEIWTSLIIDHRINALESYH